MLAPNACPGPRRQELHFRNKHPGCPGFRPSAEHRCPVRPLCLARRDRL